MATTLRDLRVSDLMTQDVRTLQEADTLSSADLEMRLAHIRHFPVLNRVGKLVGVVSSRDLLAALASGSDRYVTVDLIMTAKVAAVRADAPALEAAELLVERRIGALPVVDERSKLVGIISERDFLPVARVALSATGG